MPVSGKFIFPFVNVEGSSPDPAIFCPANGYPPEYTPYVPPVLIEETDVNLEEIIFIFDTQANSVFEKMSFANAVSCTKTFRFYDTDGNLLGTVTTASNTSYTANIEVPASSTRYVIIKVSLNNASSYFTSLSSSATSSSLGVGTEACYMNTPKITTTNFQYQKTIKDHKYYCTTDYVTSLANFAYNSSFEYYKLKGNYPLLTTCTGFSQNSLIRKIDFEDFSAPLLNNISSFIRGSLCKKLTLPTLDALQNFTYFGMDNTDLEELTLCPLPNATNITSLVQNCKRLKGTLIVPELPLCITYNSAFNGTSIEKLVLQGVSISTGYPNAFANNPYMREFEYPRNIAGSIASSDFTNAISLQIIRLPDYLNRAGSTGWLKAFFTNTAMVNLKKAYGDCEYSAGQEPDFYVASTSFSKIEEINLPKLKCDYVRVQNLPKLKKLVIDWTNSVYVGISSGSDAILLNNTALPASEINAIFSALPVVSPTLTIEINGTPASSDPVTDRTIATAKGWTVIG